jgi:hypothetical protein
MIGGMKKRKRPRDINQLAHKLVDLTTQDGRNISRPTKEQISALMAELGRKGGKKGGKRRLETMTSEERSAIATKAAQTRWSRKEK